MIKQILEFDEWLEGLLKDPEPEFEGEFNGANRIKIWAKHNEKKRVVTFIREQFKIKMKEIVINGQ